MGRAEGLTSCGSCGREKILMHSWVIFVRLLWRNKLREWGLQVPFYMEFGCLEDTEVETSNRKLLNFKKKVWLEINIWKSLQYR